jgi:hypothetical protein
MQADGSRGGADMFQFNWVGASQIALVEGQREALVQLLTLVEDDAGPYQVGLRAQRARVRAVVGQDGSLSAESVEAEFKEALDQVRAWRSALYEAHTSADYGTWLIAQGRHDEGAALIGAARDFYSRVGATRWLDALDRQA